MVWTEEEEEHQQDAAVRRVHGAGRGGAGLAGADRTEAREDVPDPGRPGRPHSDLSASSFTGPRWSILGRTYSDSHMSIILAAWVLHASVSAMPIRPRREAGSGQGGPRVYGERYQNSAASLMMRACLRQNQILFDRGPRLGSSPAASAARIAGADSRWSVCIPPRRRSPLDA